MKKIKVISALDLVQARVCSSCPACMTYDDYDRRCQDFDDVKRCMSVRYEMELIYDKVKKHKMKKGGN